MDFFKTNKTRFISHRGFTPLAPENSLPSFSYAGKFSQWAIETDLHLTKDGHIVCCHNDSLDAYCDYGGKIIDMSLMDIKKRKIVKGNRVGCFSDDELRIPTFFEYLNVCKKYGSIPFIELKTNDVDRILFYLKQQGFSHKNTIISSISLDYLKQVRDIDKNMFIHWIFADENQLEAFSNLKNAGVSLNYVDAKSCPTKNIIKAKDLGLKICLRACDNVENLNYMQKINLDYLPTNCLHDKL
ncbi:MAG: hypothetical protein J6B16_01165 [Clostridia bacterium]|nr:hypothetical protein [Clostridia bacterium]